MERLLDNLKLRGGVGILLAALLLLTGCPMQQPSPKNQEIQRAAETAQPKPEIQVRRSQEKPIRVNYLKPVQDITHPEIYVYKEKRRLYIMDEGVVVRDYPIGLGQTPQGDKTEQGDGRTPEGTFKICVKNPTSKFYLSLGIDYPQRKHAENGLFNGTITPVQFGDIVAALEHNQKPPWNTHLGGAIFIHGGGAHMDWTDGCVALYNSDMKELFEITSVGTPVTILP